MEFTDLIVERRSVRAYDAERKVSKEQAEEMVNAALMAPTWKNSETGRYYVILTDEMLDEIRTEALPPFNQNNTGNAVLIVTTFVKNVSGFSNGQPDNELGNMWGAYDLGLQNAYMVLKARDLGMDTLIMGIRDSSIIREKLNIPDEEEIVAVIAAGYRAGDVKMPKRKDADEVMKVF